MGMLALILSSLAGLLTRGCANPAMNRWAILCRPPGCLQATAFVDLRLMELVITTG